MTTDAVRRLKTYGRDLATIPISRLPNEFDKACYLIVNTYTSYRLNLGTGPLNDAVSFAKCMKNFGYKVFFVHNAHKKNFLNYLDKFLAKTKGELVIYYVGHGTSVPDLDGDEDDGYDEAFVFDDGIVIDDILVEHLIANKNPENEVVMVTDACFSGSIWDIQSGNVNGRVLPDRIMSISAANDKQTAKQTMIQRAEQGIFTYNMTKILKRNPAITPPQLQTEMRKILRKYGQSVTVATTNQSLLHEPIFQIV